MKCRVVIKAINTPRDDVTVEITSMFAATPSATLKITRHGVREHAFSMHELSEISGAISDAVYALKPKPEPLTAAQHNAFPKGRW